MKVIHDETVIDKPKPVNGDASLTMAYARYFASKADNLQGKHCRARMSRAMHKRRLAGKTVYFPR
jgi:hypothetical protein